MTKKIVCVFDSFFCRDEDFSHTVLQSTAEGRASGGQSCQGRHIFLSFVVRDDAVVHVVSANTHMFKLILNFTGTVYINMSMHDFIVIKMFHIPRVTPVWGSLFYDHRRFIFFLSFYSFFCRVYLRSK